MWWSLTAILSLGNSQIIGKIKGILEASITFTVNIIKFEILRPPLCKKVSLPKIIYLHLLRMGFCHFKIVSIYKGNINSEWEAFATGFNCARVLISAARRLLLGSGLRGSSPFSEAVCSHTILNEPNLGLSHNPLISLALCPTSVKGGCLPFVSLLHVSTPIYSDLLHNKPLEEHCSPHRVVISPSSLSSLPDSLSSPLYPSPFSSFLHSLPSFLPPLLSPFAPPPLVSKIKIAINS